MRIGKIAQCVRYTNVWDEKIRSYNKSPASLVDSIEPGSVVLILATTKLEFRIITRNGIIGWTDRTSFVAI